MPNLPRKRPSRPRRRQNPLRDAQRHMQEIQDALIDHGANLMDELMERLMDRFLGLPNTATRPAAPPPRAPRRTATASAPTLYDILEVSASASPETIEAAWKSLSKRFHPDNHTTGNAEKMKLINDAHDILSDMSKRRLYDQLLRSQR
jgi:hypothetical protein